jgi:hypothetical protein
MVLTSTVMMFGVMYLNTYSVQHIWFSQNAGMDGCRYGCGYGGAHARVDVVNVPQKSANFAIVAAALHSLRLRIVAGSIISNSW